MVQPVFADKDFVSVFKRLMSAPTAITNIDRRGSKQALVVSELLARATKVASGLRTAGVAHGSIVTLQVDNKIETMICFWACQLVGAAPVAVPLPPTYSEENSALSKLINANNLFKGQTIVASSHLVADVKDALAKHAHNVVSFSALEASTPVTEFHTAKPTDRCILSLTSGTTGKPKAVVHTHASVLASLYSKRTGFPLSTDERTLSWVPLDHLGGLVEHHIFPLMCGHDQVHVDASCMTVPLTFLHLLSEYQITHTFAPNAFLGLIQSAVIAASAEQLVGLDLSHLHCIFSGGEAVVVDTAKSFLKALYPYGLRADALRPVFGMTETCGGCIFNNEFPHIDEDKNFASSGSCCPGVAMRVVDHEGNGLQLGAIGELQLSGPVLFTGYHDNDEENLNSFVEQDGVRWFKTGDEGYFMENGALRLTGRTKDTMLINGISYFCHEIDAAIERLKFVKRGVCMSTRLEGADTEQLIILFVPQEEQSISVAKMSAAVAAECVKQFGVQCAEVVPVPDVPVSSLGKVDRKLLKESYDLGEYKEALMTHKQLCEAEQLARTRVMPRNEVEESVVGIWSRALGISASDISIDDNFFALGGNSLGVLAVKKFVDEAYGTDMDITNVYKHPTVVSLSAWVEQQRDGAVVPYDPIVPMQTTGDGTPIFFVHPGVGDVLVFTSLAKTFADERPFYGIRAPGFEQGQQVAFESMYAMATCYADAIIRTQTAGPYVVAGYSFGGVVAYETGRVLEQRGHDVDFLGMVNIPPHIQHRMDKLHWKESLINLGWFLDIVTPGPHRDELSRLMDEITDDPTWESPPGCRDEAAKLLISRAPEKRLVELNMNAEKLGKWVNIAQKIVQCGRGYEPSGSLATLDSFYAIPLFDTMEDWIAMLSKWDDFSRSDGGRLTGFTQVPGIHYTVMDEDHIDAFARIFKQRIALREWQANELRAGRILPSEGGDKDAKKSEIAEQSEK